MSHASSFLPARPAPDAYPFCSTVPLLSFDLFHRRRTAKKGCAAGTWPRSPYSLREKAGGLWPPGRGCGNSPLARTRFPGSDLTWRLGRVTVAVPCGIRTRLPLVLGTSSSKHRQYTTRLLNIPARWVYALCNVLFGTGVPQIRRTRATVPLVRCRTRCTVTWAALWATQGRPDVGNGWLRATRGFHPPPLAVSEWLRVPLGAFSSPSVRRERRADPARHRWLFVRAARISPAAGDRLRRRGVVAGTLSQALVSSVR